MNQPIITENRHPPSNSIERDSHPQSEVSEASFWDESQIQAVIRHAGATGCSPEEFFTKKWKQVLCRKAFEVGK